MAASRRSRTTTFDLTTQSGSQPSCPRAHSAVFRASCRQVGVDTHIVLEDLSGRRNRSMIVAMPTTTRPQQRYDHRLPSLVQRTGHVTVATNLGIPRSTARGWLGGTPTIVVGLGVADLT